MAEAALHHNNSEDDNEGSIHMNRPCLSTDMCDIQTTHEVSNMAARTRSASSASTKKKRSSKKKDELEALEQRFEERLLVLIRD
jgi:hypothetical protein